MSPELLAEYGRRVREARDIGALARLEREIAHAHPRDPDTPHLLADLSLEWKRLEERN